MAKRQFVKLYLILDLHPDAEHTQADIKTAYRKAARKWHPDLQPAEMCAEAHKRMAEISAAWAVLGDEARRARYDQTGEGEDGPAANNPDLKGMAMLARTFDAILVEHNRMDPLEHMFGKGSKSPPGIRDFSQVDLVGDARKVLRSAKEDMLEQIEGVKRSVAKLQDALGRLVKESPEHVEDTPGHQQAKQFDPIRSLLQTKLSMLETTVADGEAEVEDLNAALDMLEHYKFQTDPPAPKHSPATGGPLSGNHVRFVIFDEQPFENK